MKKYLSLLLVIIFIFYIISSLNYAVYADLPKIQINNAVINNLYGKKLPDIKTSKDIPDITYPEKEKTLKLAIISDGSLANESELADQIKSEIKEILGQEYQINYIESKSNNSRSNKEDLSKQAEGLLKDKNTDIILSLGYLPAKYYANKTTLCKPVISISYMSGIRFDLANSKNNKNFNNISSGIDLTKQLEAFKKSIHFNKLAIIANDNLAKDYPEVIKSIDEATNKNNITYSIVSSSNNDPDTIINNIPEDVDTVYITDLTGYNQNIIKALIQKLNDKKLPTLLSQGVTGNNMEGLVTLKASYDNNKLARQVATNIQKVLMGDLPSNLDSSIITEPKVTINMEIARKVGYNPNWRSRTDSEIINFNNNDESKILTFGNVVKLAVESNLDILSSSHEVNASKHEVSQMKANFLPHVNASVQYATVSDNLREVKLGPATLELFPKNIFLGGVTATQLIYSDKAFAGLKIKKHLYEAKKQEANQIQLEIAKESAISYLDLLKIKNIINIQRNNLEFLKTSLEQAKIRQKLGSSNPGETYRLEAEIASAKKNVLDAENQLLIVQSNVNRIINRPLDNEIVTKEIDITDPILMSSNNKLIQYIEDPDKFEAFKGFVISQSIADAPELKQLDKFVQAKEREVVAAKRSFYTPEIYAAGQYSVTNSNDTIFKGNNMWFFGVNATLPIFKGGERIATLKKVKEELEALKLKRQSAAEKLSLSTKIALLKVENSYPNIELSRTAADNAHKALDMINDYYKKGASSILSLVDAQNKALAADLIAANSVYDFMNDIVQLERSLGKVEYFTSDSNWDEWFTAVDTTLPEKTKAIATKGDNNDKK